MSMLNILRDNPRAFFYALVAHAVLIGVLMLAVDWTPKTTPVQGKTQEVVQAVAVDEAKVRSEMEKLAQIEQKKKQEEQDRIQRLKDEEDRARKQREAEEKRIVELKKQQVEAAQRRKEQEEQTRREHEAEVKRLAAVKEQRQALEEKRHKEEQRLAEMESKRKTEEDQRRREQSLREQLAAEQHADEERNQRNQTVVAQYVELIKQKVTRNWLKPATARAGMSCVVAVRLIPGGEVVEVRVTKSSGDVLFDRSVETAVRKASPLPLPPDPALFNNFRELQLIFKPEV